MGQQVKYQDQGDTTLIAGLNSCSGNTTSLNGNPLQYSCLENPTEGGAWQATVYGVTKSRTRLSNFTSLKQDEIMLFAGIQMDLEIIIPSEANHTEKDKYNMILFIFFHLFFFLFIWLLLSCINILSSPPRLLILTA